MDTITGFNDNNRFLSNFWYVKVQLHGLSALEDGITYPTVEHAYQASKSVNESERLFISKLRLPSMAKDYTRLSTFVTRPDWKNVNRVIMLELLRDKFNIQTHKALALKLHATGDAQLIESNWWHDNFWGSCTCMACSSEEKHNWLGRLLMHVRMENALEIGS